MTTTKVTTVWALVPESIFGAGRQLPIVRLYATRADARRAQKFNGEGHIEEVPVSTVELGRSAF